MNRRTMVMSSGSILGGVVGFPSAFRNENGDELTEREPIEFDGEGVTVTDGFEIDGGPTVVEGTHDGESSFFVQAVPRENGADYSFINHVGDFEGTTGAFVEEGSYVMYVDADGSWELTVRQPRVSEDEADELPLTVDGSGSDWIGPILFDGTSRIAGRYDSVGMFHVEVVPQENDASEFVWDGGELVFSVIGEFGGITSIHTDGIGYIDVDADGEWTLEVE